MIAKSGIAATKKEVLGLLTIFVIYVLIGGAVFMALESPLEEELRDQLVDLRKEFKAKLHFLDHPNISRRDMEAFVYRLATAQSNNLMDEDGNDTHINWSFYNSFFFAITVVTTIGYGHLAPSTTSGRIFCIFYAMIGIPMTGILLAAIGHHFSKHLMKAVQRAKKFHTSKVALLMNALAFLLPWFVVFMILPAGIFMLTEGWEFLEGLYYCFITLSTIGFGDYVAGNFEGRYIWIYKTAVVLWIIFGLGYLAMILNYISRAMRGKHVRKVETRLSMSFHNTHQKLVQRVDEIYHLLQEFSKQKQGKSNGVKGLSRVQSSPEPSNAIDAVMDQNHNKDYQMQRLLRLVQALKEDTRRAYATRGHRRILTHLEALNLETSSELPARRHSLPEVLVPAQAEEVQSQILKNRSNLEFLSSTFDAKSSQNGLCPQKLSVTIDLEHLKSTAV